MMRKRRHVKEEAPEDEFDAPPILQPEATNEDPSRNSTFNQAQFNNYDDAQFVVPEGQFAAPNEIEFNFVDNENVQCGICGEIASFKTLFSEHINNKHPEYSGYTLEHDGYDLPFQSYQSKGYMDSSRLDHRIANKMSLPPHFNNDPTRPIRSTRTLRKVSQIRVNINDMSLDKLEDCLNKKMVEKMGRKVPVTLVDKQHARCGLCNAVVSLNKKFEIVHLVRHFNAWHPSAHKCSGHWLQRIQDTDIYDQMKPLGLDDFAVIDLNAGAADNLQCIWCGMFMDVDSLAMHFHEIHPEEVEVPKCRLCLQELVCNARFREKFGEMMDIRLPDEHHYKCRRFDLTTSSEAGMDRALKRHVKKQAQEDGGTPARESDDETNQEDEDQPTGPEPFSNSRMSFGKRNKPKRQFIMPSLRQAAPVNSKYIQPVSECHWKCRLCGMDILAAVISAGAIKHFRQLHPIQLDAMQSELCKARLERISDGCMEFVNPEEIECLICGMTYPLHRPYNMCRAIRHLKLKHPEQMPEYNASFVDNNPELQGEDTMEEEAIENALNDGPLPLQPQTIATQQIVRHVRPRLQEEEEQVEETQEEEGPPQILEQQPPSEEPNN
ncbi:unnamed protein product [Bursaphelenchus xylophilus]|uniref:(pine wood nematode) hypothetical protein n=1 Tax=Bursaphelenchus xylophilus TaxID=6326 RepID=A0A1I7RSJ9_BURXY|nr:unnamed protein product [Bursaphelenchus xylophilus]CAG9122894.1 unnamed protein product [Bursaphelenchus xylophilus]